jgi:DHA2 family multidrug resistance protein
MNESNSSLLASSTLERWLITATVMLVAIIEVLDMTIVNVALAPMMGSLGASSDQITWILTSYIVSSAICMLLTGFLVNRFGRKRLLCINIVGFLIASMLCGIATTLPEMVLFRTLQGVFGASLVPLSQIILRTTFTKDDYGKAMAIWGVGIMVAPIFGPTIGGFITENLTWRWIFYLNIPVCILAFFMALNYIKETPTRKEAIDWFGVFLMVTGVGSLQLFFDRGNTSDWFSSSTITTLAIVSVISLTWFIIRGLRIKNNIVDLHLYKDHNFSASCFIMLIFSSTMMGLLSLQPLLLENVLGFPSGNAGLIMAPRGICAAISMMVISRFLNRLDPRLIMGLGIILALIGTVLISHYNFVTPPIDWMLSGSVQGFGIGLFFVPLMTLSFGTLLPQAIPQASGLFSFARNIGTSIGISMLSTFITREKQINWNQLSGHIQIFNNNLHRWLTHNGLQLHDPSTIQLLSQQVYKQASMIAFLDSFWFISFCLIALLPLLFFLQRPKVINKDTVMH